MPERQEGELCLCHYFKEFTYKYNKMLDLKKIEGVKSDKIGFFRFKKFDSDAYLVTNDIGRYAFLTKEEF
jgi:hypothetical protein